MRTIIFIWIMLMAAQAQEGPPPVQKDLIDVPSRYHFPVKRKAPVQFSFFIDRDAVWKPVIRLAVAVQNDFLQFTRGDSAFLASYEVTASLRVEDTLAGGYTWREKALLADFKETNSQWVYQNHEYVLPLDNIAAGDSLREGSYKLLLEVRDLSSSNRYKAVLPFKLQKPAQRFPLTTDIAFYEADSVDGRPRLTLNPMNRVLEFNRAYNALLRVKTNPGDSVHIDIRLNQHLKDQNTLVRQQFVKGVSQQALMTIRYVMPMNALTEGHYSLRFTVSVNGKTVSPEREFDVVWIKKPVYLYHPDLAIRPMRYLLTEEQREEVKGMSYRRLAKWIDAYWEKNDPTPNTRYNELIEVYFKRVSETVRLFSNRHKEGWQTDRGRIYLLYGPPEKIENRRYDTRMPHITWLYPSRGLSFTFVDRDKDKEFELLEETEDE